MAMWLALKNLHVALGWPCICIPVRTLPEVNHKVSWCHIHICKVIGQDRVKNIMYLSTLATAHPFYVHKI